MTLADVEATVQKLKISPFQERVLAVPEINDVFLGGGRGGGKSYTLALLAMRHAEQYKEKARILYLRQSFPGVADFVMITRELFGKVYGTGATFNQSSHVWSLPSGAYFEINQLEGIHDYSKFQGRSFTLLLIDEAGQWPDPQALDLLRSNLRGPDGMPVRVVIAANPGGVGHHWVAHRYVFKNTPWQPFLEEKSGREFVSCPSTYLSNPFLDQAGYKAQIEAATATDPELGRAWLDGDWAVVRGAFFGAVLDESRVAVDPWPTPAENPKFWTYANMGKLRGAQRQTSGYFRSQPDLRQWRFKLAYDHGSAKPAACLVIAESMDAEGPDGRMYVKSSRVVIDEVVTNVPGSLNEGLQYPVPRIADEIREMCARWEIHPSGVADDAIFAKHGHSSGSIGDEFRRCGVYFHASGNKDRISGWETMRRMFSDAGSTDSPGLYITRNCEYGWATLPYIERDQRRVEDVDTRGPDHWIDALRYGTVYKRREATSVRFSDLRSSRW